MAHRRPAPDGHLAVRAVNDFATKDFSFPSDHATVAGAVAGGLGIVDRRLGRIAVGLAVLMAAARVYVGAHYPGRRARRPSFGRARRLRLCP